MSTCLLQVDEIKELMASNIEMMLSRQDRLEELEVTVDHCGGGGSYSVVVTALATVASIT